MRIDLERALADIAGSAARDADPVRADRVLTRMHRRRVARSATSSVVGLGVVAVAVLGVMQLDELPADAPPAEPTEQAQDD